MEGKYDVLLGDTVAGSVELRREGLYIRVFCRCRAPEGKIWRLFGGNQRLGVPMPRGDMLELETKVAAKRLEPGCGFYLRDGPCPPQGRFVPIEENGGFPEPERLREGVFAIREGIPGVLLPEHS